MRRIEMGSLKEVVLEDIYGMYRSVVLGEKSIYQMIIDGAYKPNYYAKRKHGKWTIYDKDGWQVVGRLNEREMKNYMKLLKE